VRKFGWVITVDHIADPSEEAPSNFNAVGMMGPRGLTATAEEIKSQGVEFKMFDDDGELYYEGFVLGDDLNRPLRDFGMPNAGAVDIKIFVDGVWKTI
jgi:hypothetical protein